MSTIKIIRIERDGIGVFKHGDDDLYQHPIAKRTYRRHNGGGFPVPELEGLNLSKDCKEWFCAYISIEDFQAWILPEEVVYFKSVGFKVFLLEVGEYQIGKKQVIFTKESIISKEDITTLFIK